MKRLLKILVVGLAATAILSSAANANLTIDTSPGTGSPPATLGPYTMTPFPDDIRSTGVSYSSVASPLGGDVGFSPSLLHDEVGNDWASWSHGYTGDVYSTDIFGANLIMPSDTTAFYFYVQPSSGEYNITIAGWDGVASNPYASQIISSDSGASYFGIYATEGSVIESIAIYCEESNFAIGEFGIASGSTISSVPGPSALVLSNVGLGLVLKLKRKRFS